MHCPSTITTKIEKKIENTHSHTVYNQQEDLRIHHLFFHFVQTVFSDFSFISFFVIQHSNFLQSNAMSVNRMSWSVLALIIALSTVMFFKLCNCVLLLLMVFLPIFFFLFFLNIRLLFVMFNLKGDTLASENEDLTTRSNETESERGTDERRATVNRTKLLMKYYNNSVWQK